MASSFSINIDYSKCVNCGICVDLCEKGVYALDSKGMLYVKDERLCIGCRDCIEGCPYGALSVRGLVSETEAKGQ